MGLTFEQMEAILFVCMIIFVIAAYIWFSLKYKV
jgi:hypothetical protein